jgi:hypothetical protein
MYLFCNSRIHIITLYSDHVCVYYASMLRCCHLIRFLVRTNHPCLGVGCHIAPPPFHSPLSAMKPPPLPPSPPLPPLTDTSFLTLSLETAPRTRNFVEPPLPSSCPIHGESRRHTAFTWFSFRLSYRSPSSTLRSAVGAPPESPPAPTCLAVVELRRANPTSLPPHRPVALVRPCPHHHARRIRYSLPVPSFQTLPRLAT